MTYFDPLSFLPAPLDSDPVAGYAGIMRQLVDELGARQARQARVYAAGAQTLTTAVAAALTFDSEDFDPKAMHSTSSNTSRIVAGLSGRFLVAAGCAFVSNATGYRTLTLRRNGAGTIGQSRQVAASGAASIMTLSTIVNVAAGSETDYFDVTAFQNTGANLDTIGGSGNTWLAVAYLGG